MHRTMEDEALGSRNLATAVLISPAIDDIAWPVLHAARGRSLFVSVSLAGRPDSEFGASGLAPASTPIPSRSTNSPPSHPPTSASSTPTKDNMRALLLGMFDADPRMNQLPIKRSTTTTLVPPCSRPTVLARVPAGIPTQ